MAMGAVVPAMAQQDTARNMEATVAADIEVDANAIAQEETLTHFERNNPQVYDFDAVPFCYVDSYRLIVAIDSIDNAVFFIYRNDDRTFDTIRYEVDVFKGRHQLNEILRPKSVGFYDDHVLVLASSKKDSSFMAVLDLDGQEVNRVSFGYKSNAFRIVDDELVVVGTTQQGYNVTFLSLADGVLGMNNNDPEMCNGYSYRVKKQADRIKDEDPVGYKLTIVAVSVVFTALVCIALILGAFSKALMSRNKRRARKAANKAAVKSAAGNESAVANAVATGNVSGEVFAAISAAIYLYDEEMHDEEDTVITIQKVERAWTPWNAKYYNMNHYFQNRKK